MKLVIVDVQLTEEDPEPEAKLDEGEFIVKRIVEMKDLWKTLEGALCCVFLLLLPLLYIQD